ncbi:hypothetical protein [Paenarthrobacter sp. AB444]|uniref:hypothetical protein n=1 Tax=Paenarthrobacter sp. AB444 TaxID=3025681 RepID=UPI002366FBF1|nr:hypothetical protein [Paenarthrobacter sp. AB444]MDD7835692.1 hypothetical protein [Paenarthrobacter sp. AB444]
MTKLPTITPKLRVSIVVAFGVALLVWLATGSLPGHGNVEAAHLDLHNTVDGGFRFGLDIANRAILGMLLAVGFIASLVNLIRVHRKRTQTGS